MDDQNCGKGGMHHVALFVDEVPAALNGYRAAGHDIALYAEMNDGFAFAMVDTVARYGHMIEIYSPTAVRTDFYDRVRKMAIGFDSREPIREITFA